MIPSVNLHVQGDGRQGEGRVSSTMLLREVLPRIGGILRGGAHGEVFKDLLVAWAKT